MTTNRVVLLIAAVQAGIVGVLYFYHV